MPQGGLIDAFQDWYCPRCKKTDQTRPVPPNASRMHPCPKLKGITAPMLRKGVRAKVTAVLRQDYVGTDLVTLNDAKQPVMAVHIERDSGMDVAVFAPAARIAATT